MSITASPLRGGGRPAPRKPPVPADPASPAATGRLGVVGVAVLSGLLSGQWLEPAAGLLVGLTVLAAGLLLFRRRRTPRHFKGTDDVEATTDLPVLAELPELTDAGQALAQVLREPDGMLATRLRALHAQLLATSDGDGPRTVALTSAEAGEGRSLLTVMLGRFLASQGHRVLLIDADWCRPAQHTLLRTPITPGLSDLLGPRPPGLDEAVRSDPVSGLDLITAGGGRLGARKLLGQPMKRLLATLSDGYELVLLDLPPILAATDVLLLSRMVDRILFAIRWQHTRRSRAMGALARLRKARGPVAGIVLTRRDTGTDA